MTNLPDDASYIKRREELEKDIGDRMEIMLINIKKEYDDMFDDEDYFKIIHEQLSKVRVLISGIPPSTESVPSQDT